MKLSAFTLLEVLVALVIASISISWYLYLLSDSLDRQAKFRQNLFFREKICQKFYKEIISNPDNLSRLKEGKISLEEGDFRFVFSLKRWRFDAEKLEIKTPDDELLNELLKGKSNQPLFSYVEASLFKEDQLLYHTVLPKPPTFP